MAKMSQIDKAIAQLEADRAVLDLAIAKLKAQQQPAKEATPKRPRAVKAVEKSA